MAYLIDSNRFIEAKKRFYGMDFCPGYWDWLVREAAAGQVLSIDWVQTELTGTPDILATWAGAGGPGAPLFQPARSDMATVAEYMAIAAWVNAHTVYTTPHKSSFLRVADPWVIAYAKAHGHTVVTLERPAPGSTKVKIPDVCIHFGVPYCDIYAALRSNGAKLIL